MKRAPRATSRILDQSDEELETIAHMLMGARGYLSRRYHHQAKGEPAMPAQVISAHEKLMTRGLLNMSGRDHER